MIQLIRIEAEADTLAEVVQDLDDLTKKIGTKLEVHDENYHRVTSKLFKGRRVFKLGDPDSPGTTFTFNLPSNAVTTCT
ncbi:MAG: hypothetical protein M0R37_07910 [Bacteroidales bacterium]|nr:hypothetical protein [Bacteroidales bacterium]